MSYQVRSVGSSCVCSDFGVWLCTFWAVAWPCVTLLFQIHNELLYTASHDGTLRIWDIRGICKRNKRRWKKERCAQGRSSQKGSLSRLFNNKVGCMVQQENGEHETVELMWLSTTDFLGVTKAEPSVFCTTVSMQARTWKEMGDGFAWTSAQRAKVLCGCQVDSSHVAAQDDSQLSSTEGRRDWVWFVWCSSSVAVSLRS